MKENLENSSPSGYTGLFSQFEKLAKVSDNALKNFADNTNIRPTDWRILLPRACFMNWSDNQTWQKSSMDPTIWYPLAFYPQEEKERFLQLVNIAGDMVGNNKIGENKEVKEHLQQIMNIAGDNVGNDKSEGNMLKGNTAGGSISGGDIITELNQSIEQNPNNEYLQSLKKLTEELSKEYEKYKIPEQKRTEINQNIQDLQKEVKGIKPETKAEESLSPSKQIQIEAKTTTLVEKIFNALPETSETIANLTLLSPFSKLIRGGVQSIVDAYKKYKTKT